MRLLRLFAFVALVASALATPSAGVTIVRPIYAFVGPGPMIGVETPNGRPVTRLKAGRYTVLVKDRSNRRNFHLVGPGVNKKTSVSLLGRRGSEIWPVRLRKGIYRYYCDRHRGTMHGRIRVV